ncbi:hypothetical protein KDL44_02970 [bacterium]|nr:hypothetical protein [bacterium]
MKLFNTMIAALLLIALSACSSGSPLLDDADSRSASGTGLVQVWDANAAEFNFDPADYGKTLGELYKGNDFEADMDRMEAVVAQAFLMPLNQVQGESTMGFVHFDDEVVD